MAQIEVLPAQLGGKLASGILLCRDILIPGSERFRRLVGVPFGTGTGGNVKKQHKRPQPQDRRIHFGMGSELEKSRFGARREKRVMYVQSADHYQHDVLSLVAADANLRAAG